MRRLLCMNTAAGLPFFCWKRYGKTALSIGSSPVFGSHRRRCPTPYRWRLASRLNGGVEPRHKPNALLAEIDNRENDRFLHEHVEIFRASLDPPLCDKSSQSSGH